MSEKEHTPYSLRSMPPGRLREEIWDRQWPSQIAPFLNGKGPIDARALLARFPDLKADKNLVLDLIYEEFCRRVEAAEPIDPDTFCEDFPSYKHSLRRLVGVHSYIGGKLETLSDSDIVPWPQPKDRLLGFVLLKELGRGSFSRVYLAAEPKLGNRRVALKVSTRGGAEAETMGRLNHPHIVPIHSVQKDKRTGLTVVCMSFLGSATLEDVLDHAWAGQRLPCRGAVIVEAIRARARVRRGVSQQQEPDAILRKGTYVDGVVHLARQLADALCFIHSRGVCHRDLKPSNVLLTASGRPMLLDFNLCHDARTFAPYIGGTLPYMAPEQLLAVAPDQKLDSPLIDSRSDLFSLGVMVYQLLTGEHPAGRIPLKLPVDELRLYLLEAYQKGCRPLRQGNPHVDKKLARLVERCLAYNPHERPPSAAELAAGFGKTLAPLGRARRWLAAHSRLALAAALVLITIGLGGAYVWSIQAPYSQRQLRHGLDAYQHGQFAEAVERLDRALDADPHLGWAYFARGRAHQKLGDIDAALLDYLKADTLIKDGRVKACLGYCYNKKGIHRDAVGSYTQALAAGFNTPEVYNNLGYCYLCLNKLELADENLTEAIKRAPNMPTAFYNRSLVRLLLARRAAESVDRGIMDIEKAIQLIPTPPAWYYFDAARLYAVAAKKAPALNKIAIEYLEKAIAEGLDPRQLKNEFLFRQLQKESKFQALASKPPPAKAPAGPIRFLDPMKDLSN